MSVSCIQPMVPFGSLTSTHLPSRLLTFTFTPSCITTRFSPVHQAYWRPSHSATSRWHIPDSQTCASAFATSLSRDRATGERLLHPRILSDGTVFFGSRSNTTGRIASVGYIRCSSRPTHYCSDSSIALLSFPSGRIRPHLRPCLFLRIGKQQVVPGVFHAGSVQQRSLVVQD